MNLPETPNWQLELSPLLKRIAQQRDVQAMERLYGLTSARLMGLMLRILQDEGASADLLQELYLKVWYQAGQFYGQGSAWGWLCVIARNLALDSRRRKVREGRIFDDISPLEDSLVADISPESSGGERVLYRCLRHLKPGVRRLIVLSYVHGFSHHELQTRLAQPLGTIKSSIRRGLMELKRCLEQ
ncbi:sigma-70 family RNA polymerase sigma factor [Marinobacterium sp. D7]|uniref:sigma-70 family RNA polymerase sigma factor n=1 Tax=Marinobacterium ramblicola TaxID=2849041 RepID=UPI001C2D4202|nr:sigma-70 family RNA polymerase sigma factor [Marinobacterium ramblicola]MBV1788743.1 sigma-70 family RNA polymerase sigma factor [Marinobacterium ramblicola]